MIARRLMDALVGPMVAAGAAGIFAGIAAGMYYQRPELVTSILVIISVCGVPVGYFLKKYLRRGGAMRTASARF